MIALLARPSGETLSYPQMRRPLQAPLQRPLQAPLQRPLQRPLQGPLQDPLQGPLQVGRPTAYRRSQKRLLHQPWMQTRSAGGEWDSSE